jgi:hypothetical protein
MSQNNSSGISINPQEYMKFMKESHQIFLPEDNLEKRKTINRLFHDSCMLVQTSDGGYFVGELNWTNLTGYSINVNGKEMQFSYSSTKAIFKPQLC